jgi:cystathionine beta-lyase/cystathionine gamma-synthase
MFLLRAPFRHRQLHLNCLPSFWMTMAHTPAGKPDNNNDTLASVCGGRGDRVWTQINAKGLRFGSKVVYYAPDEATKSISAPIITSSSFQYDADIYQEVVEGARKSVNIYGRCGNPTEYQFEEQMAIIEGADACLATASGMAAISTALFGLLKQGDHIVCDWTYL